MQEFDYHIAYMKGKKKTVDDALSRHYQEVHQTSPIVVTQLMAFTLVNVDEHFLKSFEREYKKDLEFKNAFEKPIDPFSKNKIRS